MYMLFNPKVMIKSAVHAIYTNVDCIYVSYLIYLSFTSNVK